MKTRKVGCTALLQDFTSRKQQQQQQLSSTAATSRDSCPRVTRSRLLCGFALITVAVVLLLYQCVGRGVTVLCCGRGGGGAYASVDGTMVTSDVDSKAKTAAAAAAAAAARGDATVDDYYDDDDDNDSNSADSRKKRRFPQVIIIGVRKGGTRALLEFLNLHPQIAAVKREMHFFDDDVTYRRGLDWYRRQMPYTSVHEITMEKTPAYFNVETVPSRVYRMNRTCKFLLVMRDPVERAISDYTQIYHNKQARDKPFDSFESLAVDVYGTVNKSYKAIRRSMYFKHMERWLRFFRLDQFHIVDGEQFARDPASELQLVEDFIGVDNMLTQDNFYYNSTRGFYCMRLLTKEKCLAKSKGRTHPYVDPKVIKILRKFFRPMNQKFFSIIRRSFDWPVE